MALPRNQKQESRLADLRSAAIGLRGPATIPERTVNLASLLRSSQITSDTAREAECGRLPEVSCQRS